MGRAEVSVMWTVIFLLFHLFGVVESQSDSTDSTKIAVGITFGILAAVLFAVFGFFKLYATFIKREPIFLTDRPDPDGTETNSIYLRWGVNLSKLESYAVKLRHYVLFFKNESSGSQANPCTVLVPRESDGCGDYTHQGVKRGDRLVFWVLAIYASRLPLCGGMHESNRSKKVYFRGVSTHYDPNETEDSVDDPNWHYGYDMEETGPLTRA